MDEFMYRFAVVDIGTFGVWKYDSYSWSSLFMEIRSEKNSCLNDRVYGRLFQVYCISWYPSSK